MGCRCRGRSGVRAANTPSCGFRESIKACGVNGLPLPRKERRACGEYPLMRFSGIHKGLRGCRPRWPCAMPGPAPIPPAGRRGSHRSACGRGGRRRVRSRRWWPGFEVSRSNGPGGGQSSRSLQLNISRPRAGHGNRWVDDYKNRKLAALTSFTSALPNRPSIKAADSSPPAVCRA
jgi:hypothetical protein